MDIKGITHLVDEVKEDYIFVVIKGRSFDNTKDVYEAVRRGAKLIITPEKLDVDVEQIITEDVRGEAEKWAKKIYNIDGVKIIGITGTNGKTTTSFLLRRIFEYSGMKSALIGTIIWDDLVKPRESLLTTPEKFYIYRIIGKAKEKGAEFAIMEVSSIGLDQGRVDGLNFSVGIFTNLSRDHLDYHGSMENYLNAKLKLFKMLSEDSFAIVNSDDSYAEHFIRNTKGKVITFGKTGDYSFRIIEHGLNGIVLEINGMEIRCPVIGGYNAYNITAAFTTADVLGVSKENIKDAIASFEGVKGRLERVYSGDFHVFVDYAHTPDAMEKVLNVLKPLSKRLIVVFGAGGNRDRGKRPLMGEVADRLADIIVLTSDNPRFEDPKDIIRDILSGINRKENVYSIMDREEAIRFALSLAEKGDVIAILGKGHETYQEVKGVKRHFDDAEVVKSLL